MKRSSLRLGLILAGMLAALPALASGSFPSPEHPWTKRDYVDFYFAHYNGNQALPHLRNAEGRALIERLVDPKNIAHIVEGTASLADKRMQIATILMAAGEIRSAYNYAVFVGEPLSEELTRVQDFTLAVVDAAARLSQGEVGATSISAWQTTVSGVMHSLGERNVYSTDQRIRLTDAIARCYPALYALLNEADRNALSQRMADVAMTETDPGLRAAQEILVQKLK